MENPFELFKHPKFGEIRVFLPDSNPSNPWFVAADVCRALELDSVSKAISRLNDNEKSFATIPARGMNSIPTRGGEQKMLIVNEPGLYRLIFSSRKKEAVEFQNWVYHEVLPSIRKHGYYSLVPSAAPAPAVKKLDLARVYLFQMSDGTVQIIKIGHSNNIRSRVAKIERETGLKVVDMYFTPEMPRKDARLVEWAAQKKLAPQRVRGEFFSADFDEARAIIDYFVKITTAILPPEYLNRIADKQI